MTLEEARKLSIGTKIRVSAAAPYHKGRVGEFDGMKGKDGDVMTLVSERGLRFKTVFAINPEHGAVEK